MDDVGRVVRQQPAAPLAVADGRGGRGGQPGGPVGVVQGDPRVRALRQPCGGLRAGDDRVGAYVLEEERDALRRVSGVDGQVGGAALEDREERHDQVGGAGQGQGDEPFRSGSGLDQETGDPVGALVELTVRQLLVAVEDGGSVGGAGDLGREGVREGAPWEPRPGSGEAVQQAASVGRSERSQVGQAAVGVGGELRQERAQTRADPSTVAASKAAGS